MGDGEYTRAHNSIPMFIIKHSLHGGHRSTKNSIRYIYNMSVRLTTMLGTKIFANLKFSSVDCLDKT